MLSGGREACGISCRLSVGLIHRFARLCPPKAAEDKISTTETGHMKTECDTCWYTIQKLLFFRVNTEEIKTQRRLLTYQLHQNAALPRGGNEKIWVGLLHRFQTCRLDPNRPHGPDLKFTPIWTHSNLHVLIWQKKFPLKFNVWQTMMGLVSN